MAIKTASTRKTTSSSTLSSAYSSTVTITQVVITDSNYVALDDTAVSSAGGYIKIFGIGFMSGYSLYYNGVAIATSTLISSNEIRAVIPSIANGSYNLTLFNTNNTGALYVLTASGFPTWSTSSYTTSSSTINIQLVATGDAPLTYALQGGSSLPNGLSLSSGGLVSGTITGLTSSTIYTFTVIANDAQLQSTQQLITLSIQFSEPYWMYTTLLLNGEGTAATNNAKNNTIVDSSTSGISITPSGAIVQGSFSPFSASSWSNYFDGSGDYLTLAANAAFTFGTGDFTIECWIYLLGTAGNYTIYDSRTAGSSASVMVYFQGSNNLSLLVNGTNRIAQGSALPASVWTHVALSRVSGSTKLFVNGTQAGSTYTDANDYNQGIPTIGRNAIAGGGDGSFPGYISNFRIVKGTGLYTTTFTPSTTPLTAVSGTSLLTCQSYRFVDNSTNNFTITRNGDVNVQKFSPFVGTAPYDPLIHGGSVYYSGSPWIGFSQPAFTTVFTLESWLYFPAINSDKYLYVGSGATSGPLIRLDSTGGTMSIGRQGGFDFTVSTPYPIGQWFHFALVREGTGAGQTKVYFNGVLAGSGQSTTTFNAGAVGLGSTESGGQAITGYISGWRLVNSTALYTSAFTPPTSPPTAIANTALLLNFTNSGVIDQTGINNITTAGDVKISTAQKKFGSSSILFDGAGDYLSIGNASNPLFSLNGGKYTIEFWAYWVSLSGEQVIIERFTASSGPGYTLYKTSGNNIQLYGSGTVITSTTAVTTSIWYHIAIAYDGTNTRIFINGTLEATAAANITDGGTTLIVGSRTGGSVFFNGYIDELRITKGYARYTANFTAPETAFVGQ